MKQQSLPLEQEPANGPGGDPALPCGWTLATLPELIGVAGVFSDGDWVESKDQDPNGEVRLTQLADVGDGMFRDRSNRFLTLEKSEELRCTLLKPDDVLVARMPDPLGRACLFPALRQPCCTVVDVCIIRPGSPGIDNRWLMHFINSPQFRVRVAALQAGSTRKRISRKNLATIELPVPPLREQSAIADEADDHLSRLDAAVEGLQRVQANLKRYRASVLKAAVEGRLVPTEAELAKQEDRDYEPASVLLERILKERRRRWEEAELAKFEAKGKPAKNDKWKSKYKEPAAPDVSELPELPEGWCWTTVDVVGDVLLGRQRAPQYLTGKHYRPYLRVANIKDNRIDFGDVEEMDFDPVHFEKYCLEPGDILVSEGQSPHLVGQSAIYHGGVDGLCFQKTLHRFRPVSGGPSSTFAQLVFRAHVKTGVFKAVASITTNIAHLTLVKFRESRFPLPPVHEQRRISDEVDRLMSVADEVDAAIGVQLARAERLRQSVLKWAFEGKLTDQDPTDEPAHVLLKRLRTEREAAAPTKKTRARRKK